MPDIAFGTPHPPVESDGPRQFVIPPSRYTSQAFQELERAHLWPGVWLVAGVARDVENPGDWFVFELGHESILVVRDEQGDLGAFHNVCLHRGHTIRDPGMGNCKSFVCPYHAWEWSLDGSLAHVPHRARFPQGFPENRRRLGRVACQVWSGLVWISINEPSMSLEEYLGPIHEHVSRYRADDMRVNADWTAEWQCNWKTAIDGFNETYHGPATHPQFAAFLDTLAANFQFGGRHSVFTIKHGVRPDSEGDAGDEIQEPVATYLRNAGGDPAAFKGKAEEARAVIHSWLRAEGHRRGHDFTALADEQLTDTHHFYVFPNVHIDFHGAIDFTLQRFRPHATDPNHCYVDVIDFKRFAGEYFEARPKHTFIPVGAPQSGEVYSQDIERLSRVQRGMHTSGFPGAHLSNMERRIAHMHLGIDELLGDRVPEAMRTRVTEPAPKGGRR